jgi:putative ABC transport system permease protein
MIKNFIKVAWRNLRKNKASSIINIGGLSVGMAVALLIGLWIYDETSFDRYHKTYDRVAQVMQHQTENGQIFTMVAMPFPIGKELQTKYGNHFKYVVMSSWGGDHILTAGDTKISQNGIYMDKDAPALFSLTMLKGSYDALRDPHSIILSASAAKAIFGNEDPLNKLLKIDSKLDVKVTGVYEDLPYNTTFRDTKFIAPWDLYVTSEAWILRNVDKWDNNSFQTFVQLADNTNFSSVGASVLDAKLKNVPADDKKFNPKIFLNPMKDWHLRSHWENGKQTGGPIEYVRLFTIVGAFVLILACINFMNLSTARSEKRAREVGIRKAIGSLRGQLIGQFYSESLMVVLFAFVFALLLTQVTLPWFNHIADKKMSIPWLSPGFWVAGILFSIITGLISGSYPALYLSSFNPVKVLKGTFRVGRLASLPRKVLVVLQFTISLTLIAGTIIVDSQVQYTKNRPIGYDRSGLMMIRMKSPDFYGKYDVLRRDLKADGSIEEMAESSSPLTAVWSNNGGFSWPEKDPKVDADFATFWVSHEYGKTVGWQFKEGRGFSRDFATDSSAVVINEASVKFMGIKDPIGKIITDGQGEHARQFRIIGVTKDMLTESPYEAVKQAVYFLDYGNVNWIILKMNPNKSASASIAGIERTFKSDIPSAPFDYKFVDTEFASKFAAEERVGTLSTFFASLAVFISCLGLFGLASFVAEQRTKEIGVRKVLGASVANLWQMLSKDFVLLVAFSCVIAIPAAWFFMKGWLEKYPYRTSISWWVFVATSVGALVITLLTVSYQAIRAALANPVKSLKTQ